MYCKTKIKYTLFRSIYFKTTLSKDNNTIIDKNEILNNLTADDKEIWLVDLPINDKSFIMNFNTVSKYKLGKKYLLINKSTFDLFDRLDCYKYFLRNTNSIILLTKTFLVNKNTEGLLWMYKKLTTSDESYNKLLLNGNFGGPSDTSYFLKCVKNHYNKKYGDFILTKINEIQK